MKDKKTQKEENIEIDKRKPLEKRTIIGNYEIIEFVGAGGASLAYKAKPFLPDENKNNVYNGNRVVILKEIFPKRYANPGDGYTPGVVRGENTNAVETITTNKAVKQGMKNSYKDQAREIDILKLLKDSLGENNPYVFYVEIVVQNNISYAVIDTNGGRSLDKIMSTEEIEKGKFKEYNNLKQLLQITKRILEAIKPIHEKEIVHGDISPGNLFVLDYIQDNDNSTRTVITIDFNRSFYISEAGTIGGYASGSYTAPEIRKRNPNKLPGYDSDLYSVGVILFQLIYAKDLTEKWFKNKKTYHSAYLKNENADVIEAVENLIFHAIKTRINSCEEFAKEIDEIIYLIDNPHRITNLFHESVKPFIGRTDELEKISDNFTQGRHITILQGIGGAGKTSLANNFAKVNKERYNAIYKINYDETLFKTISDNENFSISNYHELELISLEDFEKTYKNDFEERAKAFKKFHQEQKEKYYKDKLELIRTLLAPNTNSCTPRNLLIIDNMNNSLDENFDDLSKFDCDILITTRNNFANCDNAKIELNQIEDKNVSLEIFKKYYVKTTAQQEDETIKKIIEKVSGLPLILELLASSIGKSGIELEKICQDVTAANFSFPKEKITYDKDGKPLNSSLDDVLAYIFDLSELEKNPLYLIILTNLSLIPYTGIKKSDLREVFSSMDNIDITDLMDELNELVNISMVQEDKTTDIISLHPLISDICTKRFEPDLKKCEKLSNWCINKVKNLFSSMHFKYCIFISERINNYDSESADFLCNIANTCGVGGAGIISYTHAEKMYKNAIEIYKRLSIVNPVAFEPNLAGIYNNLANLYSDSLSKLLMDNTEKYRETEAEQMYKQAIEIYRRLAKENPADFEPNLAESYNNLADLYSLDTQFFPERYTEVVQMHKQAIEIYKRLTKENHAAFEPDLAYSYSKLAGIYYLNGRDTKAEQMYKKAIEIGERVVKGKSAAFKPDLTMSYNDFALLHSNTQRDTESEQMHKQAIEKHERLAKENSVAFERCLTRDYITLAHLYDDTHRNIEAEQMFKQAFEIQKRIDAIVTPFNWQGIKDS